MIFYFWIHIYFFFLSLFYCIYHIETLSLNPFCPEIGQQSSSSFVGIQFHSLPLKATKFNLSIIFIFSFSPFYFILYLKKKKIFIYLKKNFYFYQRSKYNEKITFNKYALYPLFIFFHFFSFFYFHPFFLFFFIFFEFLFRNKISFFLFLLII